MQKSFVAACLVLGATAVASAQTAASPAPATSIFQPPVTLASCTPVADNTSRFLVTKPKSTPRWYRSAGTVLLQTGQRIHIAGRLVPTPNLAARAGDVDPTVPAMSFVNGDARIAAVPAPRASAIRIVPESMRTTVECPPR